LTGERQYHARNDGETATCRSGPAAFDHRIDSQQIGLAGGDADALENRTDFLNSGGQSVDFMIDRIPIECLRATLRNFPNASGNAG